MISHPHKIEIQAPTVTRTATGRQVTYATTETRYARVTLLSLEGQARLQQVVGERITHRVEVRGRVAIPTGYRLYWVDEDTYLLPAGPAGNVGQRFTHLQAREVRDDATEET